ncbi:hypothetical protein TNIN_363281 [Trichonephila inaurata madagascariensis]|uniref:Uncharacterized protein n=1 Tax=Trichonephila inaurata madagascariensis TaxID=2747483 RepID=A0A8X6XLQ3_9ARAC|nr:hypothetical protein TNIN_363281 [Trichonephila inaurata madagascariensis]
MSFHKPGTNHSIAQMADGTNTTLPDELFDQPTTKMDSGSFVSKLQNFMKQPKLVESSTTSIQNFVHQDLKSHSQMFERIDCVKKKHLNNQMKHHLPL